MTRVKVIESRPAVFLIVISLVACGPAGRATPVAGIRAAPRESSCAIQFLERAPAHPFTRLGSVGAHQRSGYFAPVSRDSLREELRARACSLGAEAVIELVETENRRFEWTELDLHGTAIRFERSEGR